MQYVLNKDGSVSELNKKKKEKKSNIDISSALSTKPLQESVKKFSDTFNNSAVKNQGLNFSNVVTDMANIDEAGKNVLKSIPIFGNKYKLQDEINKNVTNLSTNMGTGAVKTAEGVADTASDLIFNPMERAQNYAYDYITKGKKVADENLKDLKKMQQRDIKKNMTQDFLNTTGYNDIADELEKGSLITRENTAGQLAQGVGGMMPSIALGQVFGGTPQMADLAGLTGKEKLAAALGNVGRTYVSQLPANAMLTASAYGGGMEEALNEGANMNQARLYGLSDAAIENLTEMMTGGVPGLQGRGGIDQFVDPLLNKSSNKYLNALLKAGYGSFGEGLEEYTSEMLNPIAKKIYSNEPIDWAETNKRALEAGKLGAMTGAFLNAQNTMNDFREAKNVKPQNNVNTEENLRDNINTQEVSKTQPETGLDSKESNLDNIETPKQQQDVQTEQNLTETQPDRYITLEKQGKIDKNIDNTEQMVYNKDTKESVINGKEENVEGRGIEDIGKYQENPNISREEQRTYYEKNRYDKGTVGEAEGSVRVNGYKVNGKDTTTFGETIPNTNNNDVHEIVKSAKENNPYGAYVDLKDDYKNYKNFTLSDGSGNVSVTPDGDIVSVVKNPNSKIKGASKQLLLTAIENGGIKLDNFDGFLTDNYQNAGFIPVAKSYFVDEYAPENWNYDRDGRPYVVAMIHNGDSADVVAQNWGKYPKTDIEKLPAMEYDEMIAYRDAIGEAIFGRKGTSSSSFNNEITEVENKPTVNSDEFKEAQRKVKNGTATEKERSYIKTATEAQNTEQLTKEMSDVAQHYQVYENEKAIKQAENRLKDFKTIDDKARYVNDILKSDKRLNASDMAAAELVLKDAAALRSTKIYNEVLANLSIYATEQGQSIQALSLIKKLSPTSQLDVLEKIIKREQNKGNKAYENLKITDEMRNKVLDCYDENGKVNQEKLDKTMEKIKDELGEEMSKHVSVDEKIRSWRYLSMLGNPKTHIRNIVANTAMSVVKYIKDKINAAGQDIFIRDKANKTTTLKRSSKDVKNLANETWNEVKEVAAGNKYNEKTDLENRKKIFKSKTIEGARNLNEKALTNEDLFAKQLNYKRSFANYLTAQGISTKADIEANPQIVEKAKQFALQEANVATFNEENKLSEFINSADNKLGTPGKVIRGAIIPFTRTPLNIAKRGMEYTPGIGLITTIADVKKAPANMKGAVLIDGLSKQMTGSALALIGYALAKGGLVTSTSDDDKEGEFKTDQGSQMNYSIKIGDKSYDLSWLAPSSMPFFVGARMFEVLDKQEGINENIILESLASTLDPLSEMSCVSSFTDILKSYNQKGTGMIKDVGIKTGQSYLSQFVPTVVGQFARVFDDKKRTTAADSTSPNKISQNTYRTLAYKIPGLRNTLPESTDYLGNTKKEDENMLIRAFNALINPANVKTDTMTKEGKEILRVYNKTGNDDIIPAALSQSVTFNNNKYGMTRKEYNEYKKTFGDAYTKNLKSLMNTQEYKEASDDEKATMISGLMNYSKDKAKDEFLTDKGEDYVKTNKSGEKSSYISDKVDSLTNKDFTITDYYIYKTYASNVVNGKEQDVRNRLNTINTFGIDYKTYSKYMEEIGKIKGDTDKNGKTIQNSRKKKVFNYINGLNLTSEQKKLLMKKTYSSYNNYDKQIFNTINNSDLTLEEKESLKNFLKIGK